MTHHELPWPIMQPDCVRCLRDHPAPIQADVSYGITGCVWCGYIPPAFFDRRSYEAALEARRRIRDYREALKERFRTEETE